MTYPYYCTRDDKAALLWGHQGLSLSSYVVTGNLHQRHLIHKNVPRANWNREQRRRLHLDKSAKKTKPYGTCDGVQTEVAPSLGAVLVPPRIPRFLRPCGQSQRRHDSLLDAHHPLTKPQREGLSPDLLTCPLPNGKRLCNEAGRQATQSQPEHLIPHKERIKVIEDRGSVI